MKLLEALATVFIRTFGITEPTPAMQRRAAWFILGLMLAALLVVCAVGGAFSAALHRA
jgi:hypothetical protein